jgi:hypothetical protein
MKKIMVNVPKLLLVIIFCAALPLAGYGLQSPQAAAPSQSPQQAAPSRQLSLEIAMPQDVVTAGAPIKVNAITKNISASDVEVEARAAYMADVSDDSGHAPPDTVLGHTFSYHYQHSPDKAFQMENGVGSVVLKPGETWTDMVDLSTLFDFSQPGKYTVRLRRMYRAWIISNTVSFTVTPAPSGSSRPAAAPTTPSEAPFELSVKARQNPVTSAENITLLVTTRNTSDHNILLWTEKADGEQGGSAYNIHVQPPAGKQPVETEFLRKSKLRNDVPSVANPDAFQGTSGERLVLKPGEDWMDQIRVRNLYDLNQPGDYTIQVERFDPATRTMVQSNTITVTVGPNP